MVGPHGQCGLSALQSVIRVLRLENVFVVPLLLCMEATAAWVLTCKLETATPSPAQVLLFILLIQLHYGGNFDNV